MAMEQHPVITIVADVGGTQLRLARLSDKKESPNRSLEDIAVYRCAEFPDIEAAIARYLDEFQIDVGNLDLPVRLCLALPGDITCETVSLVNLGWQVNPSLLTERFSCDVIMLNDFTAQALAIAIFTPDDLFWLRPPDDGTAALTRAIVGPGTGLGVAALLPEGAVVDSEGGHISFAPQTSRQQRLAASLAESYPRLSVERLVSGPGLSNIYRGLGFAAGNGQPPAPQQISSNARAGDPDCLETIRVFTEIFGSVCGDLALAFGAKGGIYLSGGVLQNLEDLFDPQLFLKHFHNKGRYRHYCEQIPVARVLHEQPGLLGAARFASMNR